jgi:excisionase family DNA binding protein
MTNENEFLTIEQVAKLLQVNYNTVYRWVTKNKLPAAQIGGVWRVKRVDIESKFNK